MLRASQAPKRHSATRGDRLPGLGRGETGRSPAQGRCAAFGHTNHYGRAAANPPEPDGTALKERRGVTATGAPACSDSQSGIQYAGKARGGSPQRVFVGAGKSEQEAGFGGQLTVGAERQDLDSLLARDRGNRPVVYVRG